MLEGWSEGNRIGASATDPERGSNRHAPSRPEHGADANPGQTLAGRTNHEKSDGNWIRTDPSHGHRRPEPLCAAGGPDGCPVPAEHLDLPAHGGTLSHGGAATHASGWAWHEGPTRELPHGWSKLSLLQPEQSAGWSEESGSCGGRHETSPTVRGNRRGSERRHTDRWCATTSIIDMEGKS
jgi:hypothetical protein